MPKKASDQAAQDASQNAPQGAQAAATEASAQSVTPAPPASASDTVDAQAATLSPDEQSAARLRSLMDAHAIPADVKVTILRHDEDGRGGVVMIHGAQRASVGHAALTLRDAEPTHEWSVISQGFDPGDPDQGVRAEFQIMLHCTPLA